MAIFDASAATQGFNMTSLTAIDWSSYDVGGNNSTTEYSYLTDDGHDVQFYGTGFAGGSTPSAGTVTSGEIDLNNDDFANPDISFSGFSGSLVTMTNTGASGNSPGFYGEILGGNDTVTGSAFDDTLKGLGGDDTIIGGDGNDSLIGDNGNDSLDGGNGNDTLEGGAGNDYLTDGNGTDSILGGDDDDYVIVTSGISADSFDGGTGGTDNDTIDWSSVATTGYDFDLAAGT
ncbi:MAG: calcium-binding protein, partial [Parvularculaceae bacterium]